MLLTVTAPSAAMFRTFPFPVQHEYSCMSAPLTGKATVATSHQVFLSGFGRSSETRRPPLMSVSAESSLCIPSESVIHGPPDTYPFERLISKLRPSLSASFAENFSISHHSGENAPNASGEPACTWS